MDDAHLYDDQAVIDEEESLTPEELAAILGEDEQVLLTHDELDSLFVGNIDTLGNGKCQTTLITNSNMIADSERLVHNGFIGSAGEYAAVAAVNEPLGVVYSQITTYFAPVRVGDEVKFTATARHLEGRKREVDVAAHIGDIKVYESRITILVHEYHPLKIKLMDVAGVDD